MRIRIRDLDLTELVLLVGALAVLTGLLLTAPATQAQTFVNQGCSQMSNGNIIITPYVAHLPTIPTGPTDTNVPRTTYAPKRITLSYDLEAGTQVCRETDAGTTCKTVGELFPGK